MPQQTSNNQKIYKFVFTAQVKTVTLALKFPCVVSIIWKRGQKAHQVKQRKPIQKGVITFNQTLQLQVNMAFDMNKKVFLQKKTKFTILIFSEKGNKQAGEVYFDVAQLLNSKNKQLDIEQSLQKCPDKNAKLNFSLSGYMKEQIAPDAVSKRSQKTFNIQASLINNPTTPQNNLQQPDFKKKKNEALVVDGNKSQEKIHSPTPINMSKSPQTSSTNSSNLKSEKLLSSLSKQNVSLIKLQEQNATLKSQLQSLRDLQLQNQNLTRKYTQADKKSQSYYKKKYNQMKEQYNQLTLKLSQIKELTRKKQQLESTYCDCKETIGKIFNYAILNGNDRLMEFLEEQGI